MARRLELDSDSSETDARPSRALFIGGLPRSFDGPRLQTMAAKFGRVVSATVFYDDTTQRHSGAGKVTFATVPECQHAREQLKDARVEKRTLRVAF